MHIEVPFELRVEHLVKVYCTTEKADLILSFEKIKKKIGFDQAKFAIDAIENGDYAAAAATGLTYYDKAYSFGFDTSTAPQKHVLNIDDYNVETTTDKLIAFADATI